MGSLSSLSVLDLSGNSLNQAIPPELGDLSSLTELLLAKNRLTGTIPVEVGSLSSLEVLDLSENQLTGTIPVEVGSLFVLDELYLNDNRLDGDIPDQLESIVFSLEELFLSGNRFTGCIPAGLRDVASNDLADIPLVNCDVYLSDLVLSHPAVGDIELDPVFDTSDMDFDVDRTSYSAMVGPSPVTVTPTNDHNATFRYLDSSDDEHPDADGDGTNGHQVALETGRTTIKVEVTSEDEKATHTYTVGVSRPGTPGRPTVSATDLVAGDASLTVSWTAPTSTGGTGIPIVSYDIQYRERATGGVWTVEEEVWTADPLNTSIPLSAVISPLVGGEEYEVQVRAYNGARHSSWSSTVRGTPTAVTCDTGNPDLDSDCAALLSAKDVLRGTVSLNWASGTALTSWEGVTSDSSNRVTNAGTQPSLSAGWPHPVVAGTVGGADHAGLVATTA